MPVEGKDRRAESKFSGPQDGAFHQLTMTAVDSVEEAQRNGAVGNIGLFQINSPALLHFYLKKLLIVVGLFRRCGWGQKKRRSDCKPGSRRTAGHNRKLRRRYALFSPLLETGRFWIIEKQGFCGEKKGAGSCAGGGLLQRNCLFQRKTAGHGAAQVGHHRRSQSLSNIMTEGAHIGAFGTTYP